MKAIILADRQADALWPLTDRLPLPLLPVVGKSVLTHALESLKLAGFRQVTMLVGRESEEFRRAIGDGTRWGIEVRHVKGDAATVSPSILHELRSADDAEVLIVRGDVLRSPMIGTFLERTAGRRGPQFGATIDGKSAGVWLLRGSSPESLVDLVACTSEDGPAGIPSVEIDGRVSWLSSLAAYHRANLEAASGLFPGLVLGGCSRSESVHVDLRARVAPDSLVSAPAYLGTDCRVEPGAELLGGVVLANDVVVDRRATLESTVVLPHTYVGEMVELRRAIAWGDQLIRIDDGSVTEVPDAFLLADLSGRTKSSQRTAGSSLWTKASRRARYWLGSVEKDAAVHAGFGGGA